MSVRVFSKDTGLWTTGRLEENKKKIMNKIKGLCKRILLNVFRTSLLWSQFKRIKSRIKLVPSV